MTTISSPGIGSGLDVNGIVSKLMSVERQPITDLQTQQTSIKSQISALGQLKSLLATLQTSAESFSTDKKMLTLSAALTDTTVGSATVTNSAVQGSYSLEVTKLATQQKLSSGAFASSTTSLGTGTGSMTIEFGSVNASNGAFTTNTDRSAVTINLSADQMTPAGVRDAINAANKGVSASLVNDGTTTHVVITNNQTGAKQSMRISVSDPDGNNTDNSGLSALAYDPAASAGSGKNMTSLSTAGDAAFSIDGIALTSSSNTISNVMDGMTLTLSKTNAGSPTTINVTQDNTAIKSTINGFITAYNALATQLNAMTKYDASTQTAGILQGDATARSIQQQLRSTVTTAFGSGSTSRLADVGITIQTDGTLKLDDTRFNNAFSSNRDAVLSLFTKDASGTSGKGLGGTMDSLIDRMINVDGILTTRTDGMNTRVKNIDNQISTIETRLEQVQARYQRQYSALDVTVSNANSLTAYLTQQLSALSKNSSN